MIDPSRQNSHPKLKQKAQRYLSQGDWTKAEAAYKQLCASLGDGDGAGGADPLELAIALHQLAFVLEAQGKSAEATSVRERTSEILLNQTPPNASQT